MRLHMRLDSILNIRFPTAKKLLKNKSKIVKHQLYNYYPDGLIYTTLYKESVSIT